MTKTRRKIKIIIPIIITCIFIGLLALFLFGEIKAEWYDEKYHIGQVNNRLATKVADWKYDNDEKYESYTVYPLYDENDELKYFLVEFEPYGFVFVKIGDISFFRMFTSMSNSMYIFQTGFSNNGLKNEEKYTWSPYIIDDTFSQPFPDIDKKWIFDGNGDRIYYKKSPYSVTNNLNERKYLIKIGGEYVCAVKKESEFVNLVSQETFDIQNYENQEHIAIMFLVKTNKNDL